MNESQTLEMIMKNEIKDGIAIAKLFGRQNMIIEKHNRFVRFCREEFILLGASLLCLSLVTSMLNKDVRNLKKKVAEMEVPKESVKEE